jgi:hypothetical protein
MLAYINCKPINGSREDILGLLTYEIIHLKNIISLSSKQNPFAGFR